MKQRITYLLRNAHEQGGVDPASLAVGTSSLKIPSLDAAKEWRITVGASELPQEIWLVLKNSHELHLRWSSPSPYEAVPPLVSRLPPGLHVSFTPRKDVKQDALCPLLVKAFGDDVSCRSVEESFTAAPVLSERFAMSAAFQFYQPLASLRTLVTYLQNKACAAHNTACRDQVAQLSEASSVDFDFDTISHALKITAVWARGPDGGKWDETIRQQVKSDSIEVGVLNPEKPTEPEELSLGGFLTVVGEDDKPSATLFSFPSRHHPLPRDDSTAFTTSFRQPTGLHPTLELSLPGNTLTPPGPSCALHAYLTLPSTLFIDRYQLSDPLFLASQNLVSLRSLSGESDLEAPAWVLKKWGSASLFELKAPREYYDSQHATPNTATSESQSGDWNVSIPLHLRYLAPNAINLKNTPSSLGGAEGGNRRLDVPFPAVFWACEAEEGLKMSVNPFDRVNLGYDGLFGPKTMFHHIPPSPALAPAAVGGGGGDGGSKGELFARLDAPVLDLAKTGYVEVVTAVVVFLGFAWVGWKLLSSSSAAVGVVGAGRGDGAKKEKKNA